MRQLVIGVIALTVLAMLGSCDRRQTPVEHGDGPTPPAGELIVAQDVSKRLAQFAPVAVDVDEALITDDIRPVLQKLVQAAEVMDEIYLSQVSDENVALRARLAADPDHADALAYFDIMYGPWDRLEHGEPFVGTERRAPGASFYPADLTSEAFEGYMAAHPAERDSLRGYFTVVRRDGESLRAVPYSEAYAEPLGRAAALLREGAELSSDERLATYLRTRAAAFESNDYFESDVAWMQLGDGAIEVVIGPYEVYEDELMGYKASFEAFITIRDPEASSQLERISALSDDLERALPIPDEDRNFDRGSSRPIAVVFELMSAGDTRAGVQTLAFNLPNDERVREEHGYKLVLLRNVMEAKYNMILMPIAERLIVAEQLTDLSFEAFLNNTLMHESAHGLGPGRITLEDGTETEVNAELRDLYSTIEEAKADVVGLFASQWMIDNGHLDRTMERQLYATFLGGFFRSVRFGASEAHGRANMIQFNFLLEREAIRVGDDGRYSIDYDRIRQAVRDLAAELLAIEADGDYERAQRFIEQYGQVTEVLQAGLARLAEVPVDIRPSYPAAERLLAQ